MFAVALILFAPALILPIIIGPIILRSYRDDLGRMTAWLTLKPLLATPLWLMLVMWLGTLGIPNIIAPVLTILPGMILTLLVIGKYRNVVQSEPRLARVLIGMDVLRWMNTLIALYVGAQPQLSDPFYILGLVLPNIYAILAIRILSIRRKRQEQLADSQSI